MKRDRRTCAFLNDGQMRYELTLDPDAFNPFTSVVRLVKEGGPVIFQYRFFHRKAEKRYWAGVEVMRKDLRGLPGVVLTEARR